MAIFGQGNSKIGCFVHLMYMCLLILPCLRGCIECKEDGSSVHSITRLHSVIDSAGFTLILCLTLHRLARAVFGIAFNSKDIPIASMGQQIVLNHFLRCCTAVTCYMCLAIFFYQRCFYSSPKGEDLRLLSCKRSIGNSLRW